MLIISVTLEWQEACRISLGYIFSAKIGLLRLGVLDAQICNSNVYMEMETDTGSKTHASKIGAAAVPTGQKNGRTEPQYVQPNESEQNKNIISILYNPKLKVSQCEF